MAGRTRSIIELQQGTERVPSQERYLVCCHLKPTLAVLYFAMWKYTSRSGSTPFVVLNGERQPTHEMLKATLHQTMVSFEKASNLYIVSTSRSEKDIEERIEPLARDRGKISIDSVRVNDDVRAFVHERLRADPELKRWRKVQQKIENTDG